MGWSTREVAELAGTTLKAVRHYHERGLLPEPPRSANGYKSYGVAHLTQLLRIRRLVDLGAPLSRIRAMDPDADRFEDTLRALDAEAAATIERLLGVREEIARQLEHGPDSASFERLRRPDPASPDHGFLVVLSRVMEPETYGAWEALHERTPATGALAEFTRLPADTGDDARDDLAERLAAAVRAIHEEAPLLRDPVLRVPHRPSFAARSLRVALADLYSPAQLDVLARVGRRLGPGRRP
ncbi:MerR family transcriptional regulator [Nocardiopsis flavescens]|uniref:MerR family transcriptional regulator n=1 Tax=Nocardiopsis flavescens TaxID=758803 RepID=UPI003648D74F